MSKPIMAMCPRCQTASFDGGNLSGGHWWFWCATCQDHIKIPTPQFLDRRAEKKLEAERKKAKP